MKRLSRLIWVLAWAAWAWMGWRLYWELPRDWQFVRALPMAEYGHVYGFLTGSELVVTESRDGQDESIVTFQTWNAATGERVSNFLGPRVSHYPPGSARLSPKHGVLVAAKLRDEYTRCVIDLRNGNQWPLGHSSWTIHGFDESKPWVIASTLSDPFSPPKAFVVDWVKGERVFEWTANAPKDGMFDHIRDCFSLGETEEFLLIRERIVDGRQRTQRQELLHLRRDGTASAPVVVLDPPYRQMGTPTVNGRMLCYGTDEYPQHWDVIECRTGRVVFSSTGRFDGDRSSQHESPGERPVLSPNGRRVVYHRELWDVDGQRRIWAARDDHENYREVDMASGRFLVHEVWPPPHEILPWEPKFTVAVRSIEDGRLLHRVWDPHPKLEHCNSTFTLGIDQDGSVYRAPPKVNWVLLVLCQTILALPLVLVWAVLRWRRRRRMRVASVA